LTNSAAVHSDFDHIDRRWIVGSGSVAYAILLLRTAWVCDDAYITFRTVWNFLHGYGLRWNVVNRVQAYTHPLWMFVMAGASAVTGEYYFTSILLGAALSVATVVLVSAQLASSTPMALLALSALAVSKSFVDYSTSGLENALTHLLLAAFFVTCAPSVVSRRRMLMLSLLTALMMLNRLDISLLVMPTLAAVVWRARSLKPWLPLAAGLAPLASWEAFSLVYYGFLFPNTAYAKLGHGVPRIELLQQGGLYLLDSIGNDPVTVSLILSALLSPWIFGARRETPLGILLYLAFTVWVGGDFMSGRFLAAPFLCAVIHLARQPLAPRFSVGWAAALGVVWVAGLAVPRPTVLSNASFGDIEEGEAIPGSHVTDERRFYYRASGLLSAHRGVSMPDHRWLHIGEADQEYHVGLVVVGPAGFVGFSAGPTVHLVDRYGLGDPLLARLPAQVPWQIGHFERRLPAGYAQTLINRKNLIEDAGMAAYYERLRIITEEPIWSGRRFRTILRMNLGGYESFLSSYGVAKASLESASAAKSEGSAWNSPGLRLHALNVPEGVRWDSLAVLPSEGDARYSLGHIRLLP
jgi:arabinofuranosyltransferase